jgi:hypothetical protein
VATEIQISREAALGYSDEVERIEEAKAKRLLKLLEFRAPIGED